MNDFWETLALNLLEKSLNGDTLNNEGLKDLFKEKPEILDELNITSDGEEIADLDKALYGGRPQIIEIREAKPTDVFHCKACNRTFKRSDNFKRHLVTRLHAKRQRALELALMQTRDEKLDKKAETS